MPPIETKPSALEEIFERLRAVESRLEESETRLEERDRAIDERDRVIEELQKSLQQSPVQQPVTPAAPKWYDKLSVRGYMQFRYTTLFGQDNTPNLHVPADPSVNENDTFFIRRGRVVLSGDVTDHLFFFAQVDVTGSFSGVWDIQMRDFYGDIAVDPDKEFRFRVGQQTIPVGFSVNQASQVRAPLERPDAIESAVEGKRDIGAFFYWAPKEIRELYKKLNNANLKGGGDYGVFGLGAYSGQGMNRSDQNGEPHWLARLGCPFEVFDEQIIEVSVQGYTGHFVPTVAPIGAVTPTFASRGVRDERVGTHFVLFPQPFGIEAEWNIGHGPKLTRDFSAIEKRWLQGGSILATYRLQGASGTWFPFVRWQFFDGARKFATNSPSDDVDELDLGVEWSPWPELEFTVQYTHTFERTNTVVAPYDESHGEDRVGFQVQVNF